MPSFLLDGRASPPNPGPSLPSSRELTSYSPQPRRCRGDRARATLTPFEVERLTWGGDIKLFARGHKAEHCQGWNQGSGLTICNPVLLPRGHAASITQTEDPDRLFWSQRLKSRRNWSYSDRLKKECELLSLQHNKSEWGPRLLCQFQHYILGVRIKSCESYPQTFKKNKKVWGILDFNKRFLKICHKSMLYLPDGLYKSRSQMNGPGWIHFSHAPPPLLNGHPVS